MFVYRVMSCLGVVAVILTGGGGCVSQDVHSPREHRLSLENFRDEICGVPFYGASELVLVYASEPIDGSRMVQWIADELADVMKTDRLSTSGTVVIVPDGNHANRKIRQWRSENFCRNKLVAWGPNPFRGSPAHNFFSFDGRPYCLRAAPYFAEAFWLPRISAIRAGLIQKSQITTSDWKVFTPGDRAIRESARQTRMESWRSWRERVDEHPLAERWDQKIVLFVFGQQYKSSLSKSETNDIRLAELQCREIILTAMIALGDLEEDERSTELLRLTRDTDTAWRDIFLPRPSD
jgi:hypothetical protein